ncbi:hypothetical protein [Streptomyces sp. NPDC057301]|uniref:hypothetical protein n=1 Tax=Streptomyces sp. NPDC057301 TaxID=3346093 RepID=UPI00364580D5
MSPASRTSSEPQSGPWDTAEAMTVSLYVAAAVFAAGLLCAWRFLPAGRPPAGD